MFGVQPPGPRTVYNRSGISYARQGPPWEALDESWNAGDLHVKYSVGQHFITEMYGNSGYHASILSGAVPVAENDALTLDLGTGGSSAPIKKASSPVTRPKVLP